MLNDVTVKEARRLAWDGYKVSEIIKILNCGKSIYDAILGKTFGHIKDPLPFDKSLLKNKHCSFCDKIKSLEEIRIGNKCIDCDKEEERKYKENNREKIRESRKRYIQSNKERILKKNREYLESNKDKIKEIQKEYYRDNKDRIGERQKIYRNNNKNKISESKKKYLQSEKGMLIRREINKRQKEKQKNDVSYILYKRLYKCAKRVLNIGVSGFSKYLSYTKDELYNHLLSTKPDDIEAKDCHIDHIKPICSFDPNKICFPDSQEFKECFALSNLRLLTPNDNLIKSYKEDRNQKWVS